MTRHKTIRNRRNKDQAPKRRTTQERIMDDIRRQRRELENISPLKNSGLSRDEKRAARIDGMLTHAMDAADEYGFAAVKLNAEPAHYRFTAADQLARVDFWPATGRYLVLGERGKARDGDIAEVLASLSIREPDSASAARRQIESAQRAHMAAIFADRPRTPATADFDLPAESDQLEVVVWGDDERGEQIAPWD